MCERVEASVFLGQHLQDIKDSVILLDRAASVRCFNWIQMCTELQPGAGALRNAQQQLAEPCDQA
ncbi:hypothetical protein NQZ68_038618 [Dissostichus eleginoides]|nr:hypothetical protein NQZ68_038618 [Dissostichus eleginoides]